MNPLETPAEIPEEIFKGIMARINYGIPDGSLEFLMKTQDSKNGRIPEGIQREITEGIPGICRKKALKQSREQSVKKSLDESLMESQEPIIKKSRKNSSKEPRVKPLKVSQLQSLEEFW